MTVPILLALLAGMILRRPGGIILHSSSSLSFPLFLFTLFFTLPLLLLDLLFTFLFLVGGLRDEMRRERER